MLVLACVLSGCHGKRTSAPDSQAFAQAPQELKQLWEVAVNADGTNDYATAQTVYFSLMRQELTPEQRQAVNNASTALNARMTKALEAGDPAAKAALAELRKNPPNRAR